MADKIETGVGSPQHVAYMLLQQLYAFNTIKDQKTLLDVYAECLDATIGRRTYPKT